MKTQLQQPLHEKTRFKKKSKNRIHLILAIEDREHVSAVFK